MYFLGNFIKNLIKRGFFIFHIIKYLLPGSLHAIQSLIYYQLPPKSLFAVIGIRQWRRSNTIHTVLSTMHKALITPYLSSHPLKSCTLSRATIISSSSRPSIFIRSLLFDQATILEQAAMVTINLRLILKHVSGFNIPSS